MKRLLIILLILLASCSKQIPQPEADHEEDPIDPIQIEYKLQDPTV